MPVRTSRALWEGRLKDGRGTMTLGDGMLECPYSFSSRFDRGAGTNPEELLGAAHAGCYSMALAHRLSEVGFAPIRVETVARVHLEKRPDGFAISRIDLATEADVPGIDEDVFREQADAAKQGCPVSKALAGVEITLDARLLGGVRGSRVT